MEEAVDQSDQCENEVKEDNVLIIFSSIYLPDFRWGKRLLRLERAIILADYRMAVLNTLGGACAATKRTAQALILSHKKEQVATAHPTASPRLAINARIHSAINMGLLGRVDYALAATRRCIKEATALGADELVAHCRTSYDWMCGELVRSGKFIVKVKGRNTTGEREQRRKRSTDVWEGVTEIVEIAESK